MKKRSAAVIGMVACFMMMAVGAAWSENRPAIPPNGTLTDTSTGLVWLQNANCFGYQKWNQAMNSAASLKSGSCGLTDGSTARQWRLPTKEELLIRQRNQSGFNNVQSSWYWSSSTYAYYAAYDAWGVHMSRGVYDYYGKTDRLYVWPVRGGQ